MENNTHFEIMPALLQELEMEANTTRKMLALVPEDKYDWRPHPKSMKMHDLAVHIAELPSWVDMALNTDELDFAAGYQPTKVNSNAELMKVFEDSYKKGHTALGNAKESDLNGSWTMRNGDHVIAKLTKYQTVRHSYSQTAHHRAQLGVFLRLLDIPIPGSYGPSADDTSF